MKFYNMSSESKYFI